MAERVKRSRRPFRRTLCKNSDRPDGALSGLPRAVPAEGADFRRGGESIRESLNMLEDLVPKEDAAHGRGEDQGGDAVYLRGDPELPIFDAYRVEMGKDPLA